MPNIHFSSRHRLIVMYFGSIYKYFKKILYPWPTPHILPLAVSNRVGDYIHTCSGHLLHMLFVNTICVSNNFNRYFCVFQVKSCSSWKYVLIYVYWHTDIFYCCFIRHIILLASIVKLWLLMSRKCHSMQ